MKIIRNHIIKEVVTHFVIVAFHYPLSCIYCILHLVPTPFGTSIPTSFLILIKCFYSLVFISLCSGSVPFHHYLHLLHDPTPLVCMCHMKHMHRK